MPGMMLTSGCCCIDLRTSSFILGYTDLVVNVLYSMTILLFIIAGALLPVPFLGNKEPASEEVRRVTVVIVVITCITLGYFLSMIAFTVTLLVGLHKSKRKLVKVYLVAAAMFFLLDFVVFFVGFVYGHGTETVVTRIILLILEAYSFLVIRSYYYEMENGKAITYTIA